MQGPANTIGRFIAKLAVIKGSREDVKFALLIAKFETVEKALNGLDYTDLN